MLESKKKIENSEIAMKPGRETDKKLNGSKPKVKKFNNFLLKSKISLI